MIPQKIFEGHFCRSFRKNKYLPYQNDTMIRHQSKEKYKLSKIYQSYHHITTEEILRKKILYHTKMIPWKGIIDREKITKNQIKKFGLLPSQNYNTKMSSYSAIHIYDLWLHLYYLRGSSQ